MQPIPHDFVGPMATSTAISLVPLAWFLPVVNIIDLILRLLVGMTSLAAGLYAISHYRRIRRNERQAALIAEAVRAQAAPAAVAPTVVITSATS